MSVRAESVPLSALTLSYRAPTEGSCALPGVAVFAPASREAMAVAAVGPCRVRFRRSAEAYSTALWWTAGSPGSHGTAWGPATPSRGRFRRKKLLSRSRKIRHFGTEIKTGIFAATSTRDTLTFYRAGVRPPRARGLFPFWEAPCRVMRARIKPYFLRGEALYAVFFMGKIFSQTIHATVCHGGKRKLFWDGGGVRNIPRLCVRTCTSL